jgi:hypothetical protein
MARIHVSAVIPAPPARVWAAVRDFNALPAWVPVVAASRIEDGGPSDRVGCVRAFTLKDGGALREQLLALDDRQMRCTYSILESPMGVENYVATLRLRPVTATGATFAEWTAEFDAANAEREAFLVQDIGTNVFGAAFANLARLMEG